MSAIRTERLLNLLTLLLNARRPISLREIREMDEFAAYQTANPKSGERAFERDKAALVDLGVPLRWIPPEQDEESEAAGGYVVDRERYYLESLDLDPAEAALLSMAGAAALGVEHFPERPAMIRALAKIGFDVDESARPQTVAHTPFVAGADAERIGRHLQTLHESVASRQRVRIGYRGLRGSESKRKVDPYGLYYRQGIWYLVGHCHLRKGERTFHLGRMTHVESASKKGPDFDVPDSFDLSTHVQRRPWEFPNEEPVEVTIRLDQKLVPAVREIFGRRAVLEPGEGGESLVKLTVTHREALIVAVLPFGRSAEVLAPQDLRRELGAIYASLADRYARGSEP